MKERHIVHLRKSSILAFLTLMMLSSLFMVAGCELLFPLTKYTVSYH